MPVHFAAARNPSLSPVARILTVRPVACVANDNGARKGDDQLLHAALRHFGQHGLGAAGAARKAAEEAFFAGDRARYDWWLGICRTLDKRMAQELARRNTIAIA